jgi:imidazolonepropionase-like amidohydrolase
MGRENCLRMADMGVVWVPTVVTMHAYQGILRPGSRESEVARQNRDHQIGQISLARTCGVAIAAGTDAGSQGVHHGSALIEELRLLMEAGFSIQGAVQCATSNGARLLGLELDLGRLRPGMPATFIAVRGDPGDLPESLMEPAQVFVRGRPCADSQPEPIQNA